MAVNGQTLRVPLESYRVLGLDRALVRAVIQLQIRTGPQRFRDMPFVVDCAAALTSMSVAKATELGIPVPRRAIALAIDTAIGPARQIPHPGRIQGRMPGLHGWT